MKYTFKKFACVYVVFEDNEILLILNDKHNARLICNILNDDYKISKLKE